MENFELMKNAWDRMGQAERRKFAEQHKDNTNFQQFAKQYSQWATPAPTTPQPSNPQPAENNQQNQTSANVQNWGNGGRNQQSSQSSYNPSEQFDPSAFNNPNAQVQVQAGNAKQTWMPDYQDDSDARMNEITNNLNAYWNTNREYFSDRQTFNRNFQYEKRNESQKALLDSFRKRKELDQKVAGYTDWKSVSLALEEGTLTKAQLEALKVQNPKVYTQYLEDQLNKKNLDLVNTGSKSRIFNEDEQISHNTDALTDMMKKLGFDMSADGRARELYDKFKELKADPKIDTMKKDYLEARRIYLQRRREFNTLPEKIRAQSTGASETLISARISKAQRLAYDELQTLADEAQIRKEEYALEYGELKDEFQAFKDQADEDYRAFTSKMSSLWFAKGLLSFETPEQQRQGQLRQQKDLNDLNLQFAKDKANLESELTNINSKDPQTQRTALMKALDQYYKDFWSIILRPQSQVVDDILALAKKEWISVGEAMRKNFTEPLQKKSGYKMLMNKQYGISNEPTKDVVGTYNGESVIFSYDKNWHLTINKPLMNQTVSSQAGTGMTGAGLRNNNPGNIKDMNFGNVIGKDNRGFAQFATPEDGFDALVEKVKFNQTSPKSRYYGKTIAQYFQMYAPSSDGNNPKWYAQDVANRCWVSINTPISQVDTIKFAAAIAHHDSGYNYATYGKFRGVGGEVKPTEAELAYYNKGATGIDPTGKKGITQKRYNEISDYLEKNKETLDPAKQRSLDIILGSKKFTKDQESSIREAIANWSDAKTVIMNNARNLMDSWTIKDVAWYENSIYQLKEIKKLLSQYYAKWGDTWIFTGNYEKIMSQLWKVNNPNLKGIAVRIASALQIYRKDITGVAFSSQEARDIADIFPWIDKNKELNEAIINARIESMQASIDSSYGLVLGRDLYNQVKMIDIASFYAPWANVQGGSYNLVSVPH